MKRIIIFFISLAFILGQIARIQEANFGITLIDLVVGSISFIWLLWFYLIKKQRLDFGLYAKLVVVFIGVGAVGLLLSSHRLTPMEMGISFLYPLRLLVYLVFYYIVVRQDERTKHWILQSMVGSAVIVTLLGFLQYFFYPALRNLYYLGWDEHLDRLFSVFLDPNFAGAFFAIFTVFLFGLVISTRKNFLRGFYSICIILSVVALLLTYSRTGFIMLLVCLAVFLIRLFNKRIVVAVLTICLLLFIGFASNRLEGLNPLRTASAFARVSTAEIALTIFRRNPILGVGFNAYRYAQIELGYRSAHPQFPSHADASTDNSFLFVLATTGIVGFSIFVFYWVKLLQWVRTKAKDDHLLPESLFASLCGLLVGSLFINVMFYPMILLWLVILTGLVGGPSKK